MSPSSRFSPPASSVNWTPLPCCPSQQIEEENLYVRQWLLGGSLLNPKKMLAYIRSPSEPLWNLALSKTPSKYHFTVLFLTWASEWLHQIHANTPFKPFPFLTKLLPKKQTWDHGRFLHQETPISIYQTFACTLGFWEQNNYSLCCPNPKLLVHR